MQQWVAAGTAAGQPDAKTLSVGGTGDPGCGPPAGVWRRGVPAGAGLGVDPLAQVGMMQPAARDVV